MRSPLLVPLVLIGVWSLACAADFPGDGFDFDGDGFGTSDCDDADPTSFPGGTERCDDADRDEDCDGKVDDDDDDPAAPSPFYRDRDGDGFGDPDNDEEHCAAPEGFVADATDCDDEDENVNPSAAEVCDADDVDEDCDGKVDDEDDSVVDAPLWFPDEDRDGHGAMGLGEAWCVAPEDWVESGDDCDDDARTVNPGEAEDCNGRDDDCDGGIDDDDPEGPETGTSNWYDDDDSDGYGESRQRTACEGAPGEVESGGDCDDGNSSINPGMAEICEDGIDQDCDDSAEACVLSGDRGLSDASGMIVGTVAADWVGYSLSGPVDTDGDGQAEVWAGAPGIDGAGGGTGAVIRLTGRFEEVAAWNAAGLVAVRADAETGELGYAVAGSPDFDGDGVDDLVVSAPSADGTYGNSGAVYLFAAPSADQDESDALVVIRGNETNDYAGMAIAAGDFDGDGRGDVFVAQPNDSSVSGWFGNFSAGAALTTSASDLTASGAVYETLALGDLDGDGLEELVVGDYGYSRAYVYEGGQIGALVSADRVATIDLTSSSVQFGYALAVGDDFNGDGRGDLVGGAYADSSSTGIVYLYSGPLAGTLDETDADLSIAGLEDGDGFGYSVATGADSDDDGDSELLVGAVDDDYAATYGGAVYVFDGGPTSGVRTASTADGIFYGDTGSAALGWRTSSADLDGDGMADLVASGDDAVSPTTSGYVAVIHGASR